MWVEKQRGKKNKDLIKTRFPRQLVQGGKKSNRSREPGGEKLKNGITAVYCGYPSSSYYYNVPGFMVS
jgi:hypothetical protein